MLYRVGALDLDTVSGTVRRDGETRDIKGLTLAFMTALVEAAPDALDADQLARTVWRRDHVTDETIRKRVSLLRAAVGSELVRTLPDRRYVLSADVTIIPAGVAGDQHAAPDSSAEPSHSAPDATSPAVVGGTLMRRMMIGAMAMLVAMLGLVVWAGLRAGDAPPRLVNPETGDVLEAPGG